MSNIDVGDANPVSDELRLRYSSLSSYAVVGLCMATPLMLVTYLAASSNSEIFFYVCLGLLLVSLFIWIVSTFKAIRLLGLSPFGLNSNLMMVLLGLIEFAFLWAIYESTSLAVFTAVMWFLAFGYMNKQNYEETKSVKLTISISAIQFFAIAAITLFLVFKVVDWMNGSKRRRIVRY